MEKLKSYHREKFAKSVDQYLRTEPRGTSQNPIENTWNHLESVAIESGEKNVECKPGKSPRNLGLLNRR